MTDYIPPDTDLDAWGERSRLAGEYLPRIATAQGVERQQLICELAGKLVHGEFLNHAAMGVWYSPRQWLCHR